LNTFTTQQQTFSKTNLLMYLQWYTRPAPDLRWGQGAGTQGHHQRESLTIFICLAICVTCACHLVIFSEESLFLDAINLLSAGQTAVLYFTWRILDIVTKQL